MEFIPKINLNDYTMHALRTGIGSSIAILIAEFFSLDFSSSAGIITLLTLAVTKTETIRLGINRISTFLITMFFTMTFHLFLGNNWFTFGIVLTIITFIFSYKNLLSTLSVNAVSITHLMFRAKITVHDLLNEFYLLLIGLAIAIIVNQFQDYSRQRKFLECSKESVEQRFVCIFEKMIDYVKGPEKKSTIWDEIIQLENDLMELTKCAVKYQQNRLPVKDDYYVDYFEMRLQQCGLLHNLHYEIKNIRNNEEAIEIISLFVNEIKKHIEDQFFCSEQIDYLSELIVELQDEYVPSSKQEFINKARLYHILKDFEDFLKFKKRFYESIE
ncbi:aromatic acid exporter family protein [Enterococcus sp.]|uniref:aromatic acid exporter family protein n=1 Tax=Enterococcus sp. TaxID=35783 RepID=UPI002911BA81|nr:aromatic acid exporter family protein [Enterococcus sp.]MDU5336547.1 aromatic acid exporter family protein [Enterococcus sp.]